MAIFSCGESSQKSNQIIGVYDMKVELNLKEGADKKGSDFVTGALAMAEIEMRFTEDSIYYTMSMGAMRKTTPWKIEYIEDSLKIIKENKTESYFINKSSSKIELISAEQKLILSKKD